MSDARFDTITAQATPSGRGGVSIIRVSGPNVPDIAMSLLGCLPRPRVAEYHHFKDADGRVLDLGLALFFPEPHSFTGEHILELHGHGGQVVTDRLLQRILGLDVRLARPGEFSERAFLNGKIDLTQAEAIADLIDSQSEQAARSAIRSLQGAFSEKITELVEQLIELRITIEAAIDFPEEDDVDVLSSSRIILALGALLEKLHTIKKNAQQGHVSRI